MKAPGALKLEELDRLEAGTQISACDVLEAIGRALRAAPGQEVFAIGLAEPATGRPNVGIGKVTGREERLFDERCFSPVLVAAAWSHIDQFRREEGCWCVELRWAHGDPERDIEVNSLTREHPYSIALMAQAIERHALDSGWAAPTATRQ